MGWLGLFYCHEANKMGGVSGEFRGNSKIETYLKYLNLTEQCADQFEAMYPDPKNKKYCKKLMVEDPDTGEWVLYYHLHS